MFAVTIEPMNTIFFLSERPEEDTLEVQEGIEIDIPTNYASWPEGADRLEQVLCNSFLNPTGKRCQRGMARGFFIRVDPRL